jgi:beta-glucosidase
MPWIGEARAVLVCGIGGEEMATALADVLLGVREPAGRLPTTYPARVEDDPTYPGFPGEFGELRYREGVFVGYRWYEARGIEPLFPFGHGLSYTNFVIGRPSVSPASGSSGALVEVLVPVQNVGKRVGAAVIQCYVEPVSPRAVRPRKELKAFAKLWIAPGEEAVARLLLDDRSFSYWFPGDGLPDDTSEKMRMPLVRIDRDRSAPHWRVDAGRYRVHVGQSSAAIEHVVDIDLGVNGSGVDVVIADLSEGG